MALKDLILKYSQSGPRYTSYPTAPQWQESLGAGVYEELLEESPKESPLALYVHVPFCEALCYYCGCNIQITAEHGRSGSYVEVVRKEMSEIARRLGARRQVTQVSWGGGTPTFLSLSEMRAVHEKTKELFEIVLDAEVSIEVDPRVTSDEQLELLAEMGFNRISLGVQDFHPDVQKAINRIQTAEATESMLKRCRSLGFKGINFDLMYGLPYQSKPTFERTMDEVIRIRPDRIALYNYAHLPSMIPHQKILDKLPRPSAEDRIDIFSYAFDQLTHHGYHPIGMDHFAVESDELYQAIRTGNLYRNFMGYTVKKRTELIGFGASAISELRTGWFQNERKAKEYEDKVTSGGLATFRGFRLNDDDLRRKWIIQSLMCRFELAFDEFETTFHYELEKGFESELSRLEPFYVDGILIREPRKILVTPLGRLFIRNVAMVFDAYLHRESKVTYSKTV